MNKLPHAASFRDLVGYQKSRILASEIFRLTRRFPREELYSLTDQLRRSSRSIGAQIAEAWGKRRYEKSFVTKLVDADAEQQETQHWIEIAFDCGYIDEDEKADLIRASQELGRILGGMISKASLFCKPNSKSLREPLSSYFSHFVEHLFPQD